MMDNKLWKFPETNLTLDTGELHIWRSPIRINPERIPFLASLLSDEEVKRAERFYFEKDRNQFIVGRGILRILLSQYLNEDPKQIQFYYNPYGKLFLEKSFRSQPVQFNVSHSNDMLLIAFVQQADVGIDVEYIRPETDVLRLANHFFSPREVHALHNVPPRLLKRAFFNCWTRKEAFIKAKGKGLSIPLDRFDVSLYPGTAPRLLSYLDNPLEITQWYIHEVEQLVPNYVAAVAVKTLPKAITYWEYDGRIELTYQYSQTYREFNPAPFN